MKFKAIIHDNWPECPGHSVLGVYQTREAAQSAIDREMSDAAELFTDGARWLSPEIIEYR